MAPTTKVDFQQTVAQLLDHDIGRRLLAFATSGMLEEMAKDITSADLYRFASVIRKACSLLHLDADSEVIVRQHLEHLLWIQHRSAIWRNGRITSPENLGCRLYIEGEKHLASTSGYPTILITPMMFAYEDALWIYHRLCKPREIVIYGEGLRRDQLFAIVNTVFGLNNLYFADRPRIIVNILHRGGIFLTYPDFVYAGHRVHHAEFLGMNWPFSSGFITICSRPNTMLLPCYGRREGNDLLLELEEPLQVVLAPGTKSDRRWTQHLIGANIARILERMILRNPSQWQLLSTIVAECAQRAR
jgi:lauroyl/myristoyl acyltransferase